MFTNKNLNTKNWKQPSVFQVVSVKIVIEIPVMLCYSVIKRNKPLIHVTTQMNLKGLTLSERSHLPKIIHYMIPCQSYTRKAKLQEWRTDQWLPGFEGGQVLITKEWHEGIFWSDRNILLMVAVTLLYTFGQNSWNFALKSMNFTLD